MGLLVALEPKSPYAKTFEKTAEAIARVAETEPLFENEERSEERTATLLVAIAWYESRLRQDARSKNGQWFCLYQLGRNWLPDAEKALTDPEMCTRAAVHLLRDSIKICTKTRAPEERLAYFMSGHCDRGGVQSRYRMFLAKKLAKEHPMPEPSGGNSVMRAR